MDQCARRRLQHHECRRVGDSRVDCLPSFSGRLCRARNRLDGRQHLGAPAAAPGVTLPMNTRTRTDMLLLVAFCGFLFFYGLGSFGLLGADEPRYAQVAREMLERHDMVSPTLQGKPWLEKPALYYWQAMLAYSIFGVTDRAARMPSAFDAVLMVAAIYIFLRRFRPGSEADGALIAAGGGGYIRFPPGGSTAKAL